ncbi:oxygen-independent coproporphyrinogen III oxidase [Hyphomonas sp.]|uniref:oxygen-independent coproporphyrinogen III oxidase n=1 Tax=Hyphomonas sp. TaxID=87 RepID=UPI00391B6752
MKPDWIPFASRAVPRYTSYPTAADFSAATGEPEARLWAAEVARGEPLSVYLHVPFCEALCWYCGCATSVPNGYRRVGEYASRMQSEIGLWADALGPHGGIGHLHFGGGSPNALKSGDFAALIETLQIRFGIRPDAEIAVELDPRTMHDGQVEAFAAAGVTRASLGVQTLAPAVQAAVNRIQPPDMVARLVSDLRGAGVKAINMDLMYGLPHQTTADVVTAAQFAAAQGAARVSVFGYAHVPWFAKHQKAIDEAALPGLETGFEQAEAATEVLRAAGYVLIGLDHFARADDPLARAAREGRLRRNFQGYTDDPHDTLIGIGATSISQFREGFVQNLKDRKSWGEAIAAGRLPVERGIAITEDDRLRARAIEHLMCQLSVDAADICREMGAPPDRLNEALARARILVPAGLCTVEGTRVTVPPAARHFLRTVAQCFDGRLPATEGAARHAKAV